MCKICCDLEALLLGVPGDNEHREVNIGANHNTGTFVMHAHTIRCQISCELPIAKLASSLVSLTQSDVQELEQCGLPLVLGAGI